MNNEIATFVLKSLVERFKKSSSEVFLTSIEAEAIGIVLGLEASFEDLKQIKVIEKIQLVQFKPIIFQTPSEIDQNYLMCLDFGTSFSKAFACSVDDEDDIPNLYPVTFGENEFGEPNLLLPSELFIDDGQIYLGISARSRFDAVEAPQERLIDSPKQFITLTKDVADLHRRRLEAFQDPSSSLTQRDALVLYLAHLTSMAESALKHQGLSVDIKRRYAHPAWTVDYFKKNSEAMRRIIAEATALARCCGDELEISLSIDIAVERLKSAREARDDDLPFGLVDDPVLEATAAGAGALIATPLQHRVPYVIIDIGAGTTDVAGCICVNNPSRDRVTVAEVRPAAKAIPLAGNIIDNCLLKLIMSKSGLAEDTAEYRRVNAAVKRDVRREKEILFTVGSISVSLVTGDIVEVMKDEFLQQPTIVNLFARITQLVVDAAFCVAGDKVVVNVAATGGGSSLPVIEILNEQKFERDGKRIELRLASAMPRQLEEKYPMLSGPYPQIAVAIGGALPQLPAQVNSINEGIVDPGKRYLAPMYRG